MAKRRKREGKMPPFVAITWEILNSAAYLALPFSARCALPYFIGKPKVSAIDRLAYVTIFSFSYAEAKRLRFSRGTWSNVIKNLISHGFIDPVEKGGLRGDGWSSNLFKLSKRWQEYGKPSFVNLKWGEFFHNK